MQIPRRPNRKTVQGQKFTIPVCLGGKRLFTLVIHLGFQRDVDFDVENDQDRCLHGLTISDVFNPSDVQRVAELFDDPQFFVGGPYSNEIIQGQKCSNCWFISALAATSTVKGLAEKYCVAVGLIIPICPVVQQFTA